MDVVLRQVHGPRIQRCAYAFETNSEGYNHVHIALHLNRPVRFTKMANRIKRMINTSPKHPDETRETNCGVFYPPRDIQNPYENMIKYISCPSKSKAVGDVIEFEVPNFGNMWIDWAGMTVKSFLDIQIAEELRESRLTSEFSGPNFRGWSATEHSKTHFRGRMNDWYHEQGLRYGVIMNDPPVIG